MEQAVVQAVDEQLHCPLCRYDLRGLTEPRCPECGYSFTWEELRDPTRRLHDYLFEHHPERPVWSFLRTLAGGLWPPRFWKKLHPTQPSFPRRLVLYWLIVVAVVLVPFGMAYTAVVIVHRKHMSEWRASNIAYFKQRGGTPQGMSPEQFADRLFPAFPSPRFFLHAFGDARLAGPWLLLTLFWPWCSIGSMLLLWQSRRRARLLPVHVMRCVIYSSDLLLLAALVILPTSFSMLSAALRDDLIGFYSMHAGVGLFIPVTVVLLVWRLAVANKRYLRLPHAWGVAVLLQVLVFLTLAFIFGVIYSLAGRG